MESRDRQVIRKILREIEIIESLIQGYDFKREHTQIPWRAISGLRDVTAHRYQALRMKIYGLRYKRIYRIYMSK